MLAKCCMTDHALSRGMSRPLEIMRVCEGADILCARVRSAPGITFPPHLFPDSITSSKMCVYGVLVTDKPLVEENRHHHLRSHIGTTSRLIQSLRQLQHLEVVCAIPNYPLWCLMGVPVGGPEPTKSRYAAGTPRAPWWSWRYYVKLPVLLPWSGASYLNGGVRDHVEHICRYS